MSKHHLEFKGWGFSISATGTTAIVATVFIIALIVAFSRAM